MSNVVESFNYPIICAGIVTYNPDIGQLVKNINAIINQVDEVIVVDNNSENINQITEVEKNIKIRLIKNISNYGIAKALNQIFEIAKSKNYRWVLTLDQDSICDKNMISTFRKYQSYPKIGIICPRIKYFDSDVKSSSENENEYEYVKACMTSASLTSLEAWETIGGFDEWMFIDYVDNDFCMRIGLYGYKILKANSTTLNHRLGDSVKKRLLIFNINLYNHSPFRNYYYVRNVIYFIKKHHKNLCVTKYLVILVCWEAKKIIFEKNKLRTIKSLFKGFKDGILS